MSNGHTAEYDYERKRWRVVPGTTIDNYSDAFAAVEKAKRQKLGPKERRRVLAMIREKAKARGVISRRS
jgi:hypothetical protein